MRRIYLSNLKVALVDDEDYNYLVTFVWHESSGYAFRNNTKYYRQALMHKLLLKAGRGQDIDHINGNGLDNRKKNLRVCSRSENLHNSKKHRDNKSGYKGVYKHSQGKWSANIMCKGKRYFLGLFESVTDAAKAYDAAAIKYHGRYAKTNMRRN